MAYFSSGIHFGLLETATDFEGNTVTYTYDEYGRQKTATYRDDSNTIQRTVTTTYDAFGRAIEMADNGNQGNGTSTYTFDDEGRLITRDTPQGTLNHEYDVLGRMVATYTNSTRTEYEHDALGRITDVKLKKRFGTNLSGNGEHTEYVYDEAGQLDYEVGANGVTKDHLYDALGRLEQIVHFTGDDTNIGQYDGSASETLVAQFSYTYDDAGNRLSSTEQFVPGTPDELQQVFTYQYDGLNRLVEETLTSSTDPSRDYTTTYSFDLSSNRTAVTKDEGSDGSIDESTTYTYDANDRLITESLDANNDGDLTDADDRVTTYGYTVTTQTSKTVNDGAGTNVETRTQAYDVMGRLASVTIDKTGSGITTETYRYDTSGLRVSKTVSDGNPANDVTTLYLFDPSNPTGYAQVLEEGIDANDNGRLDTTEAEASGAKAYTLGHDVLTQAVAGATAQVLTLLYDIHGSTRALTDENGAIEASSGGQVFTYDAYGNAIGFDEALALTTLLYSGEWTSANTSNQYLRARFYDPSSGRFNRLDPFAGNAKDPLSFNKYQYTHGNPITGIDPSGMYSLIGIAFTTAKIGLLFGATASIASIAKNGIINPPTEISPRSVPNSHKSLAHLANDVYNSPSALGSSPWRETTVSELTSLGLSSSDFTTASGFYSRLYTNSSGNRYALAFRGTQETVDWVHNLLQGVFGPGASGQYEQASTIARKVHSATSGRVIFVGHSLGGGLASRAASEVGGDAVTFNAAGLHGFGRNNSAYVTSYIVRGEILNTFQTVTLAARSQGDRYYLEPGMSSAGKSSVELHSMAAVLDALR